ncbi:hypothetical protein PsYK624_132730 [Phanerochaete sordida]|uniref:C2H2-type domain-containing protein n=1 Tax=Phanerochaete sordida TaxID=48140 RepID=A0A9P3LJ98_9APHY|nr:hypothetical protein PsYK624_132730 [Phanerochaete sordida]
MSDGDDDRDGDVEASQETTDSEHKFVAQPNDEQVLWEVIEITNERKNQYQVRWAGVDPKTKKPWPLDWVAKKDVTPDLVKTWKRVKALKESKSGRRATKASSSSISVASFKGKQDVVDVSDDEYASGRTRKTRASTTNRQSSAQKRKPGPSRVTLSSSPGTAIVKSPKTAVKRKRDSNEVQDAVVPAASPAQTEPGSPKTRPARKRRKVSSRRSAVYISAGSPSPSPQGKVAEKATEDGDEDMDPNVVDLPPAESDVEPDLSLSLDHLDFNPFAQEDAAGNSTSEAEVPETQSQPEVEQADGAFVPEPFDPPPAYASHDELERLDLNRTRAASKHSSLYSPRPSSIKGPSKSTKHKPGAAVKGREKVLGPVPRLSPSDFRPYLDPPLSPIEQFDSPIKPRGPARNGTRAALPARKLSAQKIHHDIDLTVADQLEAEFVDYTGGNGAHAESPLTQASAQSQRSRPQSPVRFTEHRKDDSHADSAASLRESPSHSVREEPSQRILVPDSQPNVQSQQVQELRALVEEFRQRVASYEGTTTKLSTERDASAAENTRLRAELTALRAEHTACVPTERFDALRTDYDRAQEKCASLEKDAADVKKAAEEWRQPLQDRLLQAQKDAERWRERYEAAREKVADSEAEARRKTAAHSELEEKAAGLEAQALALQARINVLETQLSAVRSEKVSLEQTVADMRIDSGKEDREDPDEELDPTAARNIWLEERVKGLLEQADRLQSELVRHAEREEDLEKENARLRDELEDEQEDARALEADLDQLRKQYAELETHSGLPNLFTSSQGSQIDAWACIHRFGPGQECLKTFSSREELREHYIAVHVPK